jgi:hypothetical protein
VCKYRLYKSFDEKEMMLDFQMAHKREEIMVLEHGEQGDLVKWYIPCQFLPICQVIFSAYYAWQEHKSALYPKNCHILPPTQLIRASSSLFLGRHQSKQNPPPKGINHFIAAKAGSGQASLPHSGRPNSHHQKLPSHTQHSRCPSDISSPEHQQPSGQPVLSKINTQCSPITPNPQT